MACIFVRRQFKPKRGHKFLFFSRFVFFFFWTHLDTLCEGSSYESKEFWIYERKFSLMNEERVKHPYDWKITSRGQWAIYSPPMGQGVPWDRPCECVHVFVHLCICAQRLTHPCSPMILTTRTTCPSQQHLVPSPGGSKDTWCYWERGRDPLGVFYNDLEKRQMRQIASISVWYQLLKAT